MQFSLLVSLRELHNLSRICHCDGWHRANLFAKLKTIDCKGSSLATRLPYGWGSTGPIAEFLKQLCQAREDDVV
jgi:hypothetical protein